MAGLLSRLPSLQSLLSSTCHGHHHTRLNGGHLFCLNFQSGHVRTMYSTYWGIEFSIFCRHSLTLLTATKHCAMLSVCVVFYRLSFFCGAVWHPLYMTIVACTATICVIARTRERWRRKTRSFSLWWLKAACVCPSEFAWLETAGIRSSFLCWRTLV